MSTNSLEGAVEQLQKKFRPLDKTPTATTAKKPGPEKKVGNFYELNIILTNIKNFLDTYNHIVSYQRNLYFRSIKKECGKKDAHKALEELAKIANETELHIHRLRAYKNMSSLDTVEFNKTLTSLGEMLNSIKCTRLKKKIDFTQILLFVRGGFHSRESVINFFQRMEKEERGFIKEKISPSDITHEKMIPFDGIYLLPPIEKYGRWEGKISGENFLLFSELSGKIAEFYRRREDFFTNLCFLEDGKDGIYEIVLPGKNKYGESSLFVEVYERTSRTDSSTVVEFVHATGSLQNMNRHHLSWFSHNSLNHDVISKKCPKERVEDMKKMKRFIRKGIILAKQKGD